MYFFGKKGLIDCDVDDEYCIYGRLKKSGHHIRVLHGKKDECLRDNVYQYDPEEYLRVHFGKKTTFDRWANSTDLSVTLMIREGKKEMAESIDEAIALAEVLFRRVPNKYWNRFLSTEYSL